MRATAKSRKLSIGGTDGSAIMGLNTYQSAFDVWWSKSSDVEDSFSENMYTMWGKYKEAVIALHYARRHGVFLMESPKREWEEEPWFTGTPDRLIVAPPGESDFYDDPVSRLRLRKRGLEIKTGQSKNKPQWDVAGQVGIWNKPAPIIKDAKEAEGALPMTYWYQCQHYMHLMGFPEWDLCVLLDSCDYREYRLLYDHDWMGNAKTVLRAFWEDFVETNKPPELDWGKSVNAYLMQKYGRSPTKGVRDGDALDNRAAKDFKEVCFKLGEAKTKSNWLEQEIQDLSHKKKELDVMLNSLWREHDEFANLFRESIGDCEGLETSEGLLTWKSTAKQSRTLRKKWFKD